MKTESDAVLTEMVDVAQWMDSVRMRASMSEAGILACTMLPRLDPWSDLCAERWRPRPSRQRGERCRKEESDTLRPNNLETETSRHTPQESANVHVFCALHACPRSHYKVYLTSRWGWLYGTPGGRTLTPFPALRMCAALTHALLACARRMLGHARARALLALCRTGTGMARVPTAPGLWHKSDSASRATTRLRLVPATTRVYG